jgi:hypothetical protein
MSSKSINIKNLVEFYNIEKCTNQILINNISKFCEYYKKLENVVSKPVYNQKYNKYYSTNKSFKNISKKTIFENDTVWENYKPVNDNDNIKRIINNNLNKISNDNFEIVCSELVKEIKNIDNYNLINILNDEIYEKMIFDIKFQELYYEILKKIWCIKIAPKITIIINKDEHFYWKNKTENVQNEKLNGPFKTNIETYENINKIVNLKKIFINKLNKEFKKKISYYEQIDKESGGETKYKLRRRCYGPIEIIQRLYKDKCINQIIICDIISNLININRSHAIETLNILLKYCSTNIKSNLPTNKILQEYKNNILKIQLVYDKNFKIKFIIMDILKYINALINVNSKNNIYVPVKKNHVVKINNIGNYVEKNIFKHNKNNIINILKNNSYNKIELLKILVSNAIRHNTHSNFIYRILKTNFEKNIIKKQHFREVFKIIETETHVENNYYIFKKSCTKLYYRS